MGQMSDFVNALAVFGGALIVVLIIYVAHGVMNEKTLRLRKYEEPDKNQLKGLHISEVFPTSIKMEDIDVKDEINKFKGNIG